MIFGVGSIASAFANSSEQLIATRAFMGIGGAFIMPATLSIITNVFPGAERGKAIGFWAGDRGPRGCARPGDRGLPAPALLLGLDLPHQRADRDRRVAVGLLPDPHVEGPDAPKLDPVGALLSIFGLSSLLYGIIEAPVDGWGDSTIVSAFFVGAFLLLVFFVWESRIDHPMLDVHFFKNPRFTAASNGVMLVFFAMFGAIFIITQYFQFVLGYSPLETGVRFLPWAAFMMIVSPLSARLVHRVGTKLVVGVRVDVRRGRARAALAARRVEPVLPRRDVAHDADGRRYGAHHGARDGVDHGRAPRAKAGVGSAVNDTTRQVGGALGVAVVGSVLASAYSNQVAEFLRGKNVPTGLAQTIEHSPLGFALTAGKAIPGLAEAATNGFIDGMHSGLLVAAGAALLGSIIALVFLPARAPRDSEDAQHAELDEARVRAGAAANGASGATAAPSRAPEPVMPESVMEG